MEDNNVTREALMARVEQAWRLIAKLPESERAAAAAVLVKAGLGYGVAEAACPVLASLYPVNPNKEIA